MKTLTRLMQAGVVCLSLWALAGTATEMPVTPAETHDSAKCVAPAYPCSNICSAVREQEKEPARLFVKILNGKTLVFDEVDLANTRVAWLKDQIYDAEGLAAAEQILICGGKQLVHDATLWRLGLRDGDTIDLSARLVGGTMQISVQTPTGRKIVLEVEPKDTVEELKKKIEHKRDIPFSQQYLFFKGTHLENSKTLSDYGIKKEAILELRFKTRGNSSGLGPVQFADMKNKQEKSFSEKAPKWRLLCKGLNLEGTCVNKDCEANGKRVWVNKGFVKSLNMNKACDDSQCPLCHEDVEKVRNCGFFKCKYSWEGKTTDKKKKKGGGFATDDSGFTYFSSDKDDSGKNHLAKWKWLEITTEKLIDKKKINKKTTIGNEELF